MATSLPFRKDRFERIVSKMALTELVPGLSVGEADRPGRRLRFLTAGDGGPPILLVPGAGETALDWLPILPRLASLSTVVAVDRAGLGLSDPCGHVSEQTQVDDIVALLAQTGPAVLVGHSWGGLLAQLVAWRRPDIVAGLVLVDPSHEELFASAPASVRLALVAMGPTVAVLHATGLFPRVARSMARKLATLCTSEPRLQAAVVDAYLRSYRHRHQVRMIGKENRLAETNIEHIRRARAGARQPDVPLVVLTATKGKPPALQRRSAILLASVADDAPRGRQILVENSGHYIHHDQPDVVVDAIAAVLAEVRGQPGRG
jgi:pimeloyl-ACP methyl ester carboxylesterase